MRLQFRASIDAIARWGSTSPEVDVTISYDPGDRTRALDLLQQIVDTARAEQQPQDPEA